MLRNLRLNASEKAWQLILLYRWDRLRCAISDRAYKDP